MLEGNRYIEASERSRSGIPNHFGPGFCLTSTLFQIGLKVKLYGTGSRDFVILNMMLNTGINKSLFSECMLVIYKNFTASFP